MKQFARSLWLFLAASLVWGSVFAVAPLKEITVLADQHYPPYAFRDAKGELTGLTIDLWRLWEKKTGVRVHIIATDWAEAQTLYKSGKGDVIDMMFRTPEREKTLSFSEPYADLPVQIYTDQDIGGISSVTTLQGFLVGVKAGDACGELLRGEGVLIDARYDSYEDMVNQAGSGRLRVFCMDEAPGSYLMFKAGIDQRFRKAFSLYTGQFHRAYRIEHLDLKDQVEAGFNDISDDEMDGLRNKWLGSQIKMLPWSRYLAYSVTAVGIMASAILLWSFFLRRTVRQRTAALRDERRFLRTLINTLPDLVWLKDKQGAYQLCNARVEQYFGAPESQIIGRTDQDFVQPDQVQAYRLTDEAAMAAQGPVASHHKLTYRSDGHVEFVETIKTPMHDSKGQLMGVLGISRDVTQHRQNELRIERLNRLYRVLMDINEIVSHKSDPHTLYQAMCDVVVRHSGVKMVWAGEPDSDKQRIVPVCWAGDKTEYARELVLPLDGPENERTPAVQAYFEGKPNYCDAIETDARMGANRDAALG